MPGQPGLGEKRYADITRSRKASVANDVAGRRPSIHILGAVVVALLFGLPLFWGLGETDLTNDEALYASLVRHALETGDWLTQHDLQGDAFLEKPPLKTWIVAAGIRTGLLPDDLYGLRFWDALFGVAAFLYVYAIGAEIEGALCGASAALLLFLNFPLLFEHGLRSHNMEAMLVLAYAGGVLHLLRWARAARTAARRAHALAFWAFFAFAFLGKFAAALLLPLIAGLAIALAPPWRARAVRDRGWIACGAVLAQALVAPWFVYQWVRNGSKFWEVIWGYHVYRRFTLYVDPAHVQSWDFYLSALWTAVEDVSVVVVPGAALWLWRAARQAWPEGRAVLLWIAVPLALLSCGTSKLSHYLYPFVAPLGLFGGYLVSRVTGRAAATCSEPDRPGWRRWVTPLALTAGLLAAMVGCVTALYGPLHLELGPLSFSNSVLDRPGLIAGVCALIAVGRTGLALQTLGILALVMGLLPRYLSVWEHTGVRDRSPSDLALCLQRRSASGTLLSVRWAPLMPEYAYHLRWPGLERRVVPEQALIDGAVEPPAADAVIVVRRSDLAKFRRLGWFREFEVEARSLEVYDSTVLFSGAYRLCATIESGYRGRPRTASQSCATCVS